MDLVWIILIAVGVAVLFSIVLSIASFSSERFMQQYEKYNSIYISEGFNILDFVHNLNHLKFNGKIKIAELERDTQNFYIPKTKTVGLSKRTLTSNSIASFAIVSHEMGHALQDFQGNKLSRLNKLRKLGGMIGFLFMPSLLAAVILLFFPELFTISIILFSVAGGILLLAALIKAITISIEKDASNNGLNFLKEILSEKEVSMCKKLLNSARLTYWGDLFRLLFSWTLLTRKTVMFR